VMPPCQPGARAARPTPRERNRISRRANPPRGAPAGAQVPGHSAGRHADADEQASRAAVPAGRLLRPAQARHHGRARVAGPADERRDRHARTDARRRARVGRARARWSACPPDPQHGRQTAARRGREPPGELAAGFSERAATSPDLRRTQCPSLTATDTGCRTEEFTMVSFGWPVRAAAPGVPFSLG